MPYIREQVSRKTGYYIQIVINMWKLTAVLLH